jgi:hypothetical protein
MINRENCQKLQEHCGCPKGKTYKNSDIVLLVGLGDCLKCDSYCGTENGYVYCDQSETPKDVINREQKEKLIEEGVEIIRKKAYRSPEDGMVRVDEYRFKYLAEAITNNILDKVEATKGDYTEGLEEGIKIGKAQADEWVSVKAIKDIIEAVTLDNDINHGHVEYFNYEGIIELLEGLLPPQQSGESV